MLRTNKFFLVSYPAGVFNQYDGLLQHDLNTIQMDGGEPTSRSGTSLLKRYTSICLAKL